jgi:hypothetical protein
MSQFCPRCLGLAKRLERPPRCFLAFAVAIQHRVALAASEGGRRWVHQLMTSATRLKRLSRGHRLFALRLHEFDTRGQIVRCLLRGGMSWTQRRLANR